MDNEKKTHLAEAGFQSQQSTKCDLLIAVTDSKFSYVIVDMLHDQIKAFGEVACSDIRELESSIKEDPLMSYFYRKVKISLQTSKFAFIPEEVFQESHLPAYSSFLQAEAVQTNLLKTASIKNVTSFDTEKRESLSRLFPSASFYAQSDPFTESALKFYYSSAKQLFVGLAGNKFEVLLTEGKQVIFYNLFRKRNADEFNYYILSLLQHLNLDPKEIPVVVSGEYDAEATERLEKYFTEIHHAMAALVVNIPDEFKAIDQSKIFTTSSLLLCE